MSKLSTEQASFSSQMRRQIRQLFPLLLVVYVPLGLIFLVLILQRSVPVSVLLNDTTYESGVPFYTGLLSNLGILIWMTAAAVSGFTYALLRYYPDHPARPFLLASTLLTVYLTLDDFFLLHDEVFLDYVGISEPIVFGAYILMVAAYVFAFRRTIRRSEYTLLILAGGFFAISLTVDNVQELLPGLYTAVRETTDNPMVVVEGVQQPVEGAVGNLRHVLEDGTKLFGIVAWCLYFVRYCTTQVRDLFKNAR